MPISATLAANEAMNLKRQSGEYVLPLGFGEAGLPVHPSLTAKLAEHSHHNGYGPVAGIPQLRSAAAGYWSRRGLPTEAESVVAGPGSKSLLFGLLMAINGDVVVPQPSWVSYAAQIELLGCTPMLVPARDSQGGVPDPALLADYLDHAQADGRDVRAIVMTLPDNPTGTIAAHETLTKVCRIAQKYDLTIISDEIYRDLMFDRNYDYLSPAEVAPERTVITTGLSKSLALGGWRIGVARLPSSPRGRALNDQLQAIASEVWSSPAQPVQHAAAYAFDEPSPLRERVAESRALHAKVSQAVAQRFTDAGALVDMPAGGFYLYPDLAPFREHLESRWSVWSGADLTQLLLDEFGVGVLPAHALGDGLKELRFRVATSQLYGQTEQQQRESLRSAYPLLLPWVSKALDRLEDVLQTLTTA